MHTGVLDVAADEELRIHIFLDRSVVEVFVNERVTLTNRIYGLQADQLEIELVAHDGRARLITLDAWSMNGIWSDG